MCSLFSRSEWGLPAGWWRCRHTNAQRRHTRLSVREQKQKMSFFQTDCDYCSGISVANREKKKRTSWNQESFTERRFKKRTRELKSQFSKANWINGEKREGRKLAFVVQSQAGKKRKTDVDGEEQGEAEKQSSGRDGRTLLLGPGMKVIGSGLEKIIDKKYTQQWQSPSQVWFPWQQPAVQQGGQPARAASPE